jgi:hypothetical protein
LNFTYAGGDDEYLANESECVLLLDVRASENVGVKPIPLNGYGYDARRYDCASVGERSPDARVCGYVGLEIERIKNLFSVTGLSVARQRFLLLKSKLKRECQTKEQRQKASESALPPSSGLNLYKERY